jgi:hypothetical protein
MLSGAGVRDVGKGIGPWNLGGGLNFSRHLRGQQGSAPCFWLSALGPQMQEETRLLLSNRTILTERFCGQWDLVPQHVLIFTLPICICWGWDRNVLFSWQLVADIKSPPVRPNWNGSIKIGDRHHKYECIAGDNTIMPPINAGVLSPGSQEVTPAASCFIC